MILGAGADVAFGLPTVPRLARELMDFCARDGKAVNRALREKIKHVRLSFGTVGAEAGEKLISRLFAQPNDVSPKMKSLGSKLKKIEAAAVVGGILDKLAEMADRNEVRPELFERLPGAVEGAGHGASGLVLDPERMVLTAEIRTAIRTTFQNVLPDAEIDAQERQLAEEILASVTSVEDLLSEHFARFSERNAGAERRTYLYLAWILWAFLRFRASSADRRVPSIYAAIDQMDVDVVTFNYTNFFPTSVADRVRYFHGRLDQYIHSDTREVVADDSDLAAAVDSDSIVAFLQKLKLDPAVEGSTVDLPAIVPPLTFKPLMSRAQLRTWAEVDVLMQNAPLVLVVGYSFAQVDEHFNELLRKGRTDAPVIAISPRVDVAWRNTSRALGLAAATPKRLRLAPSGEALRAGRLTCIKGRGEDFSRETLEGLLAI